MGYRVRKLGDPVALGLVEPRTYRSGRELECRECGHINDVPATRLASWRCKADLGDRRCGAVHCGSELDPLYR